jgi:integrase
MLPNPQVANLKFTEANVKSFKSPAGKMDHIEFDDSMPGFGLRVRGGTSKYYVAQYRVGKKSGRTTLGNASKVTLADAKVHAKKVFDLVAAKINPAVQRTRAAAKASQTFDRYIDPFLAEFKDQWASKYYSDNTRALKIHFRGLHGMALDDIQIENVALELTEIRRSGITTMNRSRSALSKFFNWAIGQGFCRHNPVDKTNKAKENARDRALGRGELKAVWHALGDDEFSKIVKLLILTLQREAQIGKLRVAEINFEDERLEFPRSRVKNKKSKHIIPLPLEALTILKSIPMDSREFVFGKWDTGFSNWTHAKEQLDGLAKLNEPWVLHDLRRTGKTAMEEELEVLPHISEAILNHAKKDMDKVYNNANYLRQKLDALTRYETYVMGVVS